MAVGLGPLPELLPVRGVRLASVQAGIRYKNRTDLVIMAFDAGSTVAGTFTRNAFCAAPVLIAKEHMQKTSPLAFVINTGNANAGTGEEGMAAAQASCEALATQLGCKPEEVLPFSTGVIGELLPVEPIRNALPDAVVKLSEDDWKEAAHGILTTDTLPKGASRKIKAGGGEITVTGIAKGSGMIRPDMATMLAYIATDAKVAQVSLQDCLTQAVNKSFNRITVDGDTSTNDACMLVASGASGVAIQPDSDEWQVFSDGIAEVCRELAQAIIRDGEGATKFITVAVEQGTSAQECLDVAYTIAHSPLVKTAFFASDPNWGRILAAIGRAGLPQLDIDKVSVYLNEVCIVEQGGRAAAYTEEAGQAVMDQEEITIRVLLGRGEAQDTVWTTDLSHEYVRINAEYRS